MKKIASRVFALLGGCLTALFIAEFVLEVSNVWIGRHSDTMFTLVEYDPYLGWKTKPNLNTKVDLVDVEDIPVQTNTQGFWDQEFSLKKPENVCRIIFLGDSFTWGMGVREEERFSYLLQTMNPRWETLNFGVPGYGTDQALLLWQRLAHSFKPDMVVLTVYENDYKDNMFLVRYGRRKPYFEIAGDGDLVSKGVPVEPIDFWKDGIFNKVAPPYESFFEEPTQKRSRIIHWLAKNSNFARSLYTLWRRIETPSEDPPLSTQVSPPSLTVAQEEQVELLLALVSHLAEEVQAQGAKLIILFAGHLTPRHGVAMAALKTREITVINATSTVLAEQISSQESVYYRFSKHWTPAAHRAVAAILGEILQKQGLCEVTV